VIEKRALATESGGPGSYRGGLGYEKDSRLLQDAYFISTADRSILSPYGVRGGKAALPYRAIVNPGKPEEKALPGLVDDLPLRKGDLLRLMTTGGGGWGDPLERERDNVRLDVVQGRVSRRGAREDYGWVLRGEGEDLTVDAAATDQLRRERASMSGEIELIDRGPGYAQLVRSAT